MGTKVFFLWVVVAFFVIASSITGCAPAGIILGSAAVFGTGEGAPIYMAHEIRKNLRTIAFDKKYGKMAVVPLSYKETREKVREKLDGYDEDPIYSKKNKQEIARVFINEYGEGLFIIVTVIRKSSNQTIIKVWKGEPTPYSSNKIVRNEDKGYEEDEARYFAEKFGGKVYTAGNSSAPSSVARKVKKTSLKSQKKYHMTVIVVVRRANLREGPSTQYRVIKILRYGDKLIAIKETGGGWVMVKGKGVKGYIYRRLIVPKK